MQNIQQLLNRDNWVKYLELAIEEGLTDVAIANDIVAHISEVLNKPNVVGQSEQLVCPNCKSKNTETDNTDIPNWCKDCGCEWANQLNTTV